MSLLENTDTNGAWIDGQFEPATRTFAVVNPATLEVIGDVADVDQTQIDQAITAAHDAMGSWAAKSTTDRAQLLRTWAYVIEEHTDELAQLASAESGKLVREARGEVGAGIAALRWSADMAERLEDQDHPPPSSTRHHFTTKEPVGVVACITPWNFPIAAVLVKVGAAIAAGCTVVVKPSEETPMVALALGYLSSRAGIADGVVNVVATANPSAFGDAIAARKEVRAISFTGSTRVGKLLYEQCAATVKRIGLELGGNAPFVVFADADVEQTVEDAVNARFYNTGQICVGANRFLVHEDVFDEFANSLAARVDALTVGHGSDDSSDLGPLINRRAKDHFEALLADATSKGAQVLSGGVHPDADELFVEPIVLVGATPDMDVHSKEIFGPMACLYRFSDDDDVASMANDTDAGLAAYAYSQDIEALAVFGRQLHAGVVGLNTTQIFDSALPFGGVKESGIGREHGEHCLDEFLEVKSFAFEMGEQE